ncbi:RDD family protein [Winogradskyella aurantiaca]|uniref:RDD family protein n=1 Tax=Winogradskyella aurantiaca TaxID=2219558 RepID=UPI000E1D5EF7|nr:RDD family protein [Winogradskyella aurantiaca]
MNEFQIETAQNVGINQNVANIGDRMIAYIIDSLIIWGYTIMVFILLGLINLDFGDSWAVYLLMSLPAFLYYVLLETFWDGKTIGKYVQGTRVVKLDGSKPGFSNYFVRWILRIVDVVITFGGAAVLSILIKGNGQRLGDIAAGTTVISERQRVSISDTILEELPLNYQPVYSQVTVLNDKDLQTVKNLYDEAIRNGQHNVILHLQSRLVTLLEVDPKEKPVDFVAQVIRDYNYYTQQ